MPAPTRFSGKFPESADYPVAVIVSCPTRIHKKERSFNFVYSRWKKTGRKRGDIEGNVYESTQHYTTQARCGSASIFSINRAMVSFWGGADSAANNASAAIPTSLMTGWASRNWFIRTSNVGLSEPAMCKFCTLLSSIKIRRLFRQRSAAHVHDTTRAAGVFAACRWPYAGVHRRKQCRRASTTSPPCRRRTRAIPRA